MTGDLGLFWQFLKSVNDGLNQSEQAFFAPYLFDLAVIDSERIDRIARRGRHFPNRNYSFLNCVDALIGKDAVLNSTCNQSVELVDRKIDVLEKNRVFAGLVERFGKVRSGRQPQVVQASYGVRDRYLELLRNRVGGPQNGFFAFAGRFDQCQHVSRGARQCAAFQIIEPAQLTPNVRSLLFRFVCQRNERCQSG